MGRVSRFSVSLRRPSDLDHERLDPFAPVTAAVPAPGHRVRDSEQRFFMTSQMDVAEAAVAEPADLIEQQPPICLNHRVVAVQDERVDVTGHCVGDEKPERVL
ncbi:MAG: hypothetical protein ACT4RN_19835 [Pseudonocardia sp.]